MAEMRGSPEIIGAYNALQLLIESSVAQGIDPGAIHDGGILAVDLYESADAYAVRTMVPGVPRKKIIVSCDRYAVTLVVLVPEPVVGDCGPGDWRIRELGSGPFARCIPLASAIVPERVETRFADGLLTIRLPKAE